VKRKSPWLALPSMFSTRNKKALRSLLRALLAFLNLLLLARKMLFTWTIADCFWKCVKADVGGTLVAMAE
jgi:hypothetical protein